jgi:murein L,D-transpeptidase YafK
LKLFLLFFLVLCVAALAVGAFARLNVNPLPHDAVADRVVVEKSARRMTLLKNGNALKVYRVALGRAPIGAKECEGDQRTPEGIYSIDFHKPDSDYHLALHVSYPEQRDVDRAAAQGLSAGSDIMIHGLPNGTGALGASHRIIDWTAGCIALTDEEIEELYRVTPDNTTVEIKP